MRYQSLANSALILLAVGVVAGCGSETAGTPSPKPDSSAKAPSTQKQPTNGAPDVTDPLNTSAIEMDPCHAVSEQQLESFPGSLDETKPETSGARSKTCAWIFNGDEGYSFGDIRGGVNVDDDGGLGTLYQQQAEGKLGIFKPVDAINGYPALVYNTGQGRDGRCVLAVGLNNEHIYITDVSFDDNHPSYESPCEPAKKFAGLVVENLKEGQ